VLVLQYLQVEHARYQSQHQHNREDGRDDCSCSKEVAFPDGIFE